MGYALSFLQVFIKLFRNRRQLRLQRQCYRGGPQRSKNIGGRGPSSGHPVNLAGEFSALAHQNPQVFTPGRERLQPRLHGFHGFGGKPHQPSGGNHPMHALSRQVQTTSSQGNFIRQILYIPRRHELE